MKVIDDNFLFPSRHIPPCFLNEQIINKLDNILNSFGTVEDLIGHYYKIELGSINSFKGFIDSQYGFTKGTEPIQANISKPNGGNRIISIPNPIALLPLHFYLYQNSITILNEQEEDTDLFLSSSKFFLDKGQIVTQYGYEEYEVEEIEELNQRDYNDRFINSHKICDGKYYHLAIDISNFYNSIYTHTISWDLKDTSKKQVFENLDILTRTMNYNETKGILIGPYSSSLFAEILLSKVDRAIMPKCITNDISYTRYCDDFDLYCDSKESLENTIKKAISEVLSKYKLDLNMEKMKLEEFPFISLNTVQNKTIFLFLERIKNEDYKDSLEFIESVMNEINNSLKIKYSNCNYLLKILISLFKDGRVPSKYLNDQTSEILLDFLINMMFKNNLISANIAQLIELIISKSTLNKINIIEKWIKKRDKREANIKEITDIWLMYLILTLEIKSNVIDTYVLKMLEKGDLELVLSLEYFFHHDQLELCKQQIKDRLHNIKVELQSRFDTNWIKAGYYSKYWLLFYINSTRWKIHNVSGYKNSILKDMYLPDLYSKDIKEIKLFKSMYDNDVQLLKFNYDNPLL